MMMPINHYALINIITAYEYFNEPGKYLLCVFNIEDRLLS
jgi:hypothetical protein